VPSDSKIYSFNELRGKSFLFTDPASNAGYWYPLKKLKVMGETPETFFNKIQWTGSHDRSIQAVAQRMSDGASVSSLIYSALLSENETYKNRVRIIEESPPYPTPPVVVRKSMPITERNHLVDLLTGLANTPEGKKILQGLGIDAFVPANNAIYASIQPPEKTP